MIRRSMWYFGGLTILTLGQRLFVEAGLGAGSFDALCVGISAKISFSAGSWIWIIGIIMMLISAILYRQKPDIAALFTSFIFGLLFDFWGMVLSNVLTEPELSGRVLLYCAGIILAPLGTAIYFESNFSKSAFDGFVVAISDYTKISIGRAKTTIEIVICLAAFLIGGPVGITTVITAVLFGPILQEMLNVASCKRVRA